MASLIPWLYFSGARDVAGDPIDSGSAYFYQPDSSTPVDIFADPEETEPLDQPVTLDAAGRATVYCAVQCEILIKSAAGATLRTGINSNSVASDQIDVTGSGWSGASALDDILDDIQSSLGDQALYKESEEDGVVQRSYHNVLHRYISTDDFGAAGNGTQDDTTALQNAIDRAIATDLPLYVESGTYKVTEAITITGPLRMVGPGADNALIFAATDDFDLFTIDAGESPAGCCFRDFSVLTPLTAGSAAFNVTRATHAVFDGLRITAVYGITGVAADFTDSRITGCRAITKNGTGFVLGERVTAYDCRVEVTDSGTGDGFWGYDSASMFKCVAVDAVRGFYPQVSTVSHFGCTTDSCTTDLSLTTSGTCLGSGNSWDIVGALATNLVTIDHGTVASLTVLPSSVHGGTKVVTMLINSLTAANPTASCVLTGDAAFTTGIKTAVATKSAADGTTVCVLIGGGGVNNFSVTVDGISSTSGASVTLAGY